MSGAGASGRPTAILASPGSIDGYPPVQAQAQLLVEAGFVVELVTTRFPHAASTAIRFEQPGVLITIAGEGGRLGSAGRMAAFVGALTKARLRARRRSAKVVEVAYDATGVLYSDLAPFRPRFRIAHFHEHLVHFDVLWRECRLVHAIAAFDRVVVPDAARAELLKATLGLNADPLVVPNFPIRDDFVPQRSSRHEGLEVIYSGSIGYDQKIDLIGRSVALWPDRARLTIVGPADRPIARQIRQELASQVPAERIRFEQWLDFSALPSRLANADLGISLLTTEHDQWQSSLGASNKRYLYMKAGLPQIGDMNPGVTELVEGRGVGRCLREFDPHAIAAIVAEYANNPGLVRSEGERAFDLYRHEFNYQQAFAPLLETIRQLIDLADQGTAGREPALRPEEPEHGQATP